LIAWLEDEPDWRRPLRVEYHFPDNVYPAQLALLRTLGVDLVRKLTRAEEEAETKAKVSTSDFYALTNGAICYWTGSAWREAKRSVGVNLLTQQGYSMEEARRAISLFPVAADYTFDPTTTDRTVAKAGETYLNIYRGMPRQPARHPWGAIHQLLMHLVHGDDEGLAFVLDWLAKPLQALHAGKGSYRCLSALVFHGGQGTGKGWFSELMHAVYGQYWLELGQKELSDNFEPKNFQAKLIVIANEVRKHGTGASASKISDRLKLWITEPYLTLRRMNKEAEPEHIHFNIVFMSNSEAPVTLEDTDRRYSVWWQRNKIPRSLILALKAEKAKGWPSASGFLAYLLTREVKRDLWEPYENEDRARLMRATADSTELFADDVAENGLINVASKWHLKQLALRRSAGALKPNQNFAYTTGYFVHVATLCEIYQEWCGEHGFPYLSRRTSTSLVRSMVHRMPWLVDRKGRIESVAKRGLDGVPLQPGDQLKLLEDKWEPPTAPVLPLHSKEDAASGSDPS
jgi:hypothetical protein